MLEEVFEIAIRDASLEVFNGAYTSFKLADMVDITQIIPVAQSLLNLKYNYSKKDLPGVIDEFLTQLPGGQDWREGR